MAVIPPWLNVTPSSFLQAMQAGAQAGLQVAGLRQRGRAEADRLALAASEAAARREEAAASRAAALDFQRWQQEQKMRQDAAALAQAAELSRAGLQQKGLESMLRTREELAKQEALAAHQGRLQDIAQGRLDLEREKLGKQASGALPPPNRFHMTTVDGRVIATDRVTGESRVVWPREESGPVPTPGNIFESSQPVPELFGGAPSSPGLFSLPPTPTGSRLFSSPGPAIDIPAESRRVERFIFKDGHLIPAE